MTAKPVHVRMAILGDYDVLVALFDELDEFHRQGRPDFFQSFDGPARTRQQVEQWLSAPGSTVLVAERGADVIGLAVLLTRTPSPFAGAVPRKVIEPRQSRRARRSARLASRPAAARRRCRLVAPAGRHACRGGGARLQSRRTAVLRGIRFLGLGRSAGPGGVRIYPHRAM
jgi:hypothetical protein